MKTSLTLAVVAFLQMPFLVFAYSEKTTHPALTQEIVRFYNQSFPEKKLSGGEIQLAVQGSIAEDNNTRWLYHFYDPIYNRGLVLGENELFRERGLAAVIGGTRQERMSSKEWAKATRQQAGLTAGILSQLFSGKDDHSWGRAVYEYAWGDKSRGLLTLGHILHLIEDATVPDHTRNDAHPPILDFGSPFESWAQKFTPQNFSLEKALSAKTPHLLNTLDEYFEVIANYSNRNFFSKDSTLGDYRFPEVKFRGNYAFHNDGSGEYEILYKERVKKITRDSVTIEEKLTLLDPENKILNNYWQRLSQQAVLHGAGVVKLFFDEVEKEKQTKALYSKNKLPWAKAGVSAQKGLLKLATAIGLVQEPPTHDPLEVGEFDLEQFPGGIPGEPKAAPVVRRRPRPPQSKVSTIPAKQALPILPPPAAVDAATSTASSGVAVVGSGSAIQSQPTNRATEDSQLASVPASAAEAEPEVLTSAPVYRRGPEPDTAAVPEARDVVINEIAWVGTANGSPDDEWIELYNRSAKSFNLTGWVLRSATDEKPYINLSGTLSPGGYYLIERDAATVTSVSADLTASFGSGSGAGLVDNGEVLVLHYGSTTIDQTPALNSCNVNSWCGGSSSGRRSMERVDPDLAGTDTSSWGTNDAIIRNGTAAGGTALNATPRARNSRHYYISQTGTVTASQTVTAAKSPYFVDTNDLTISSGVTLTIEPGVVIKFYDTATDLFVNGTLKALGSSAANIVFTSFKDDAYGGDMNGDGSATSPAAGDWRTIVFNSSSANSELSYVRVRYGGKWLSGQAAGIALVKVDNTSITVSNSILEKSLRQGLWLINSTSTISSSTIQNNAVDGSSYGIFMDGGASIVQNSTLASNNIGIRIEGMGSPTISANTFSSNTNEAISVVGSAPSISSNSASSNGINGTVITGNLAQNYTFGANLPYVIDSTLTLFFGKTFNTAAGAVFKGKTSSSFIDVQGVFNVAGTSGSPVVFTSLKDDTYGGDTNGDGSATSPAAGDWVALNFISTATSSAVNQALVRYGGNGSYGALTIDSVGVDVSNSTFEFNKFKGLRLTSATSTLSNLTIRNHTSGSGEPTGLSIENGSRAVVANSAFSSNAIGVISTGGSTVSNGGGNTFSGNTTNSIPTGLLQ